MVARIILLGLFFIYPSGFEVPHAKLDSFNLSIATDKSAFVRREPIPVRVTVTNETRRTIKTDSIPVIFQLTKRGKDSVDCRLSDCFSAATYWAKEFRQGTRRTLEVDLTDLYWKDLILSGTDLRRPKNFYQTIAPGEYSLFLEFHFPDGGVTSNVIVVKIDRKKS
jgi:hypothetical protein